MRSDKTYLKLNSTSILSFGLLLLALWLGGCAAERPSVREAREKAEWIEATLKRVTLEEKISQMVMSRAYGYYYSNESDEYRRLEHLVKDHKVGGLIFFQGDVYENAVLINRLQEMADVPLLIASDFEWGTAMRIRRATRFPEAMALGATRDTQLAFAMGKAIAEESRAIGIHQDFAPVADVNVNPENPVINTRSFGEDPALVAELASAFAEGLQVGGVLATAKHFPGHGDTQIDSHIDLPIINVSRERMDSVELVPFRQLIQRGVSSIMIAHVVVPAIQQPEVLPATLSPRVINRFLQNDLGFKGLVVTDAMDMGAIVQAYGSDSAAVLAVEAGVDVLLILADEDAAIEALMNEVKNGRISEERINVSVRKILEYKWSLGLARQRTVDLAKIPEHVGTREHLLLAKQIARDAITVLKTDSLLPLERFGNKKILNIIVGDVENYRTEIHRTTTPWPNEPVGDYFVAQLRRRYSTMETVRIDPSSDSLNFETIRRKAKAADILLCPIFSKARSGSGIMGLPEEMISFLDSIIVLQKPTALIALGSPYILQYLSNATAYLCTYSDCEVSTEAAVEALFGEIPARGKLPITIPSMFAYGDGIQLPATVLRRDFPESVGFNRDSLARIDSIITKAIRDSAFPGAQVVVVKDGAIAYNRLFGSLDYSPESPSVDGTTIYDIASLTKVIATTSAIMKLYDEGLLNIDDSVVQYIPAFGNRGKETITIRNLLLHNAGLPAFKRLYLTCTSPEQVLDSVYNTELIYTPGDSTVYSDFGFIVLGKIVEKISGVTLDRYVDSVFFKPLKMGRTMFNPPESLWESIVPTELDTVVRKKLVRGIVHDENAWTLGGVSGHAGLFSTASDLAIFMQMLMNGGHYGGKQYLKPETIQLFTTKQGTKSTRAFGWDTKTVNGYSSAGKLFSATSFGHTGFTGTSIWTDPEREIFVILLTNRIYPTRNNPKIMQIRPAVHDVVMSSLLNYEGVIEAKTLTPSR